MDTRREQLVEWLKGPLGSANLDIHPASADASFRRYFRVRYAEKSVIAMDAPPDKEDSAKFIRIAQLMRKAGLNVPEIIEADLGLGFLLITDLGETQYLQALNTATVDALYRAALVALQALQTAPLAELRALPPYDDALLTRELGIFDEWFLARHLGIAPSAQQRAVLDAAYAVLKRSALEQPKVCVHRDFHSRNLMVTPQRNPGVLDFQDAVYGPVTYDLASLLRDCYIEWPRARVEQWAEHHRRALASAGVQVNERDEFRRWFDWMGMQRHLKAIGIFARLNRRDGKPGYLKDIPRTLAYVLDVAKRYPEFQELHTLLVQDVQPRIP